MKRIKKLQRLNEDLFAPLTTEESKLVGGGARTASVTGTFGSSGGDVSGTIDFTF